jgi:hypothetical protein
MTVSELIDQLRAMPPDVTVMLWSRMDDPQHRRLESVELFDNKIRPVRRGRCAFLIASADPPPPRPDSTPAYQIAAARTPPAGYAAPARTPSRLPPPDLMGINCAGNESAHLMELPSARGISCPLP